MMHPYLGCNAYVWVVQMTFNLPIGVLLSDPLELVERCTFIVILVAIFGIRRDVPRQGFIGHGFFESGRGC